MNLSYCRACLDLWLDSAWLVDPRMAAGKAGVPVAVKDVSLSPNPPTTGSPFTINLSASTSEQRPLITVDRHGHGIFFNH